MTSWYQPPGSNGGGSYDPAKDNEQDLRLDELEGRPIPDVNKSYVDQQDLLKVDKTIYDTDKVTQNAKDTTQDTKIANLENNGGLIVSREVVNEPMITNGQCSGTLIGEYINYADGRRVLTGKMNFTNCKIDYPRGALYSTNGSNPACNLRGFVGTNDDMHPLLSFYGLITCWVSQHNTSLTTMNVYMLSSANSTISTGKISVEIKGKWK